MIGMQGKSLLNFENLKGTIYKYDNCQDVRIRSDFIDGSGIDVVKNTNDKDIFLTQLEDQIQSFVEDLPHNRVVLNVDVQDRGKQLVVNVDPITSTA